MKTPLDEVIIALTKSIHANSLNTPKLILFLQDHLLMIRTLHKQMLSEDFYEILNKNVSQGTKSITLEESIFNPALNTRKAILNYLLLLYLLNQLGRTLNKQYRLSLKRFPKYYQVKLYRDKVAEHWDDYVFALGPKGVRFQKGKAPVPDVTGHQIPREKQAKQIVKEFYNRSMNIRIPGRYIKFMMVSSEKSYSDYMFERLKRLNKELKFPIGDSLITLLFEFGFPTPICDVEEYLTDLTQYITRILKRRNYLLL